MEGSVEVDPLRNLYYEMKDKLMPEEERLRNDVSDIFFHTIEDKIDHKELLNINVRGEVRTGKSTVAIYLMWYVNLYLKKIKRFLTLSDEREINEKAEVLKKRLKGFKWGHVINSDQTEFLRFINKEWENVCIVIDEWNKLAKTGANATTEEALFDYYSDVFAGKYVHRIATNPAEVVDSNATMILDVLGRDLDKGITRCKLSYRNAVDMVVLTLGYVDFDVSKLIEQPFFKAYKLKKYRRMELLDKHGVRDIRELEFAEIILEAIGEAQEISDATRVSQRLVVSIVDEIRRKHKRIYSMIAIGEIANRVCAVTELFHEVRILKLKLTKKNADEKKIWKVIYKVNQMARRRVAEQEKLKQIYKIYRKID